MDKTKFTGLLLAGGKSTRMGKEKGMVLFRGKHLYQYPLELLKKFCSEILISTSSEDYRSTGLQLVADEYSDCGPLSGIYSGLKACNTDYLLVIPCDMPFVSEEIIGQLVSECSGYEITLPGHGDFLEPLCAVYSKSLLPAIGRQMEGGDYGPLTLVANSKTNIVRNDSIGNPLNADFFRNINTPEDLRTYDPFQFPMPHYPKLALICGSGQKVGKTYLASLLIRKIAKSQPLAAIKISPHHHDATDNELLFEVKGKYRIFNERAIIPKDSSLFYQAGASPVLFIESNDEPLLEAFEEAMKIIGDDKPIVCESGALARRIKPGLLVFVQFEDEKNISFPKNINRDVADLVVKTSRDGSEKPISEAVSKIFYHDGWLIDEKKL